MDVYVGEDALVPFQFLVDGEFVSPSAASYSVRDNDGTVVLGPLAVNLSTPLTEYVVTVLGANNSVGAGLDFENRTVELQFIYQGETYRLRKSYRVTRFLLYTSTAADVRRALGVLDHELSDDDVDLTLAYFEVRDAVTQAKLDAALVAGNSSTLYANLAVTLRAAINLVPTLQLRVAQATQDDNLKFTRLSKLDFDKLADQLMAFYDTALLGIDTSTNATDLTLLSLSTPVDAITGA